MSDPIVERIEREAGIPGLAAVLARLPPTDLRSLLLEVTRRRVAGLEPRDVLRRWKEDRLARPAEADPARLDELERRAFELLPPAVRAPRALSRRAARDERRARPDPAGLGGRDGARWRGRQRLDQRPGARVRAAAPARPPRRRCASAPRTGCCARSPSSRRSRSTSGCWRSSRRDAPERRRRCSRSSSRFYLGLLEPVAARPWSTVSRASRRTTPARPSRVSVAGRELVEGGFVDWTQRLLGDRKERLLVSGIGLDLLSTIDESTRR